MVVIAARAGYGCLLGEEKNLTRHENRLQTILMKCQASIL